MIESSRWEAARHLVLADWDACPANYPIFPLTQHLEPVAIVCARTSKYLCCTFGSLLAISFSGGAGIKDPITRPNARRRTEPQLRAAAM